VITVLSICNLALLEGRMVGYAVATAARWAVEVFFFTFAEFVENPILGQCNGAAKIR
jgi:hypothetical protein